MVEIKIKSHAGQKEKIELYKKILYVILVVFLFVLGYFIKQCPECPECQECEVCQVCEPCEEKIIYQNITKEITKYVCSNNLIVDEAIQCQVIKQELPELNPVLTNEEGTLIKEVKVGPACVGGELGGYVSYNVSSPAENVTYQVKEEDGEYQDMSSEKGLFRAYRGFLICTPDCPLSQVEFTLEHNKRYLFRIKFDRTQIYGRIEYSNEHVIDLTSESRYMTKEC